MKTGKNLATITTALAGAAMLLALPSCDWIQYSFVNSIPAKGDPKKNPVVNVYLGVDGLSYYTVQEAMKRGAFGGKSKGEKSEWNFARFVTAFPGTSDYSWNRMLHGPKIGGYEMEYFNPKEDVTTNTGFVGLIKHITPAVTRSASSLPEYMVVWDYFANGYLHNLNAYGDTFKGIGDTFDNLFYLLDGQIEHASTYSAYMLEFDVLGHMQQSVDVADSLVELWKRIERFRADHPEREIHFTIVSDHGMDFTHVPAKNVVALDADLETVGVKVVKTLKGRDASKGIFAVPIIHTRVTYVAIHTLPEQAAEVALRASKLESSGVVVSRVEAPAGAAAGTEWFGLFIEGALALHYGFDPARDVYFVPREAAWAKVDLKPSFATVGEPGTQYVELSDEEAFKLAEGRRYPDLFYRVRTSLAQVGIRTEGQVIVSMKPGYASVGYQVYEGQEVTTEGHHGILDDAAAAGTLLTTERELPANVRADNLLELFPKMKRHFRKQGLKFDAGDPNASLDYR